MSSIFTIVHPVVPLEFSRLLDFINASYVLEMSTASSNGNSPHSLLIKGSRLFHHYSLTRGFPKIPVRSLNVFK